MTRWVFVRHAQSVANRDGWLAGHEDPPLTEQGRAEARALATRLPGPFDRVYASNLARAVDTARLLVSSPAPVPVPALRERALGSWERASREALRADGRMATLLAWDARPPGGESFADVARRAASWLATVDDGGPTLVVAHSTLLRALLAALDDRDRATVGRWRLSNLAVEERTASRTDWQRLLATL